MRQNAGRLTLRSFWVTGKDRRYSNRRRQPYASDSMRLFGAMKFLLMPWPWTEKRSSVRFEPPIPGIASIPGSQALTSVYGVAHSLISKELFSGWGIRTVASWGASIQSYFLSQWLGVAARQRSDRRRLARYGFKDMAGEILSGLLAVSTFVDLNRLPELFCALTGARARDQLCIP